MSIVEAFSVFSAHTIMLALGGLFLVCLVAAVWIYADSRGYRSRGRRRQTSSEKSNRSADRRKLSSREKKLYVQAKILLKHGKPMPAARILEQLNMPREAIQALEDHGEIHEAANILMRMQRQNRAGVVYARHGMWADAAKCFQLARMPLESAKCFREVGDFLAAARFFETAQRLGDAAECYENAGEVQNAARIYIKAERVEDAVRLYREIVQSSINLASLSLDPEELGFLVDYLSDGNADLDLADLIISRNKLTSVLNSLVAKGHIKQAADIYLRSATDIGPQLISEVSYTDRCAENLAAVFLRVSHFSYAGMVYERMESFDRAGDAFEKAEDFERSAYCFDRAGNPLKVKILREKAANSKSSISLKTPKQKKPSPSPFALSEVEETAEQEFAFQGGQDDHENDEKTEVLSEQERFLEPTNHVPTDAGDSSHEEEVDVVPPPEPVSLDKSRAIFHSARFFSDLDFAQKNKLWDIGHTRDFAEGEVILDFNDEAKGVYVIVKGHIDVYRLVRDREKYVDRMRESESFGELWLLADQPTSVKFVAAKDVKVHIIERCPFDDLMDKDGTVARKLYKRFTTRLLRRLLSPQNDSDKSEVS